MREYLTTNEISAMVNKSIEMQNHNIALLITIATKTGMRIGDILSLSWEEILLKECISFTEKRTKKNKVIALHSDSINLINSLYLLMGKPELKSQCFVSQKHGIFTVQRINQILKKRAAECGINDVMISSHSLRKSFGREIYYKSKGAALSNLMDYFSHPTKYFTLQYLQIFETENTYYSFDL